MQCDDPCHHCFMCDDDAKEGQEGKCVVCYKKAELRKTTCELCIDKRRTLCSGTPALRGTWMVLARMTK